MAPQRKLGEFDLAGANIPEDLDVLLQRPLHALGPEPIEYRGLAQQSEVVLHAHGLQDEAVAGPGGECLVEGGVQF
ncbi:hypothetical protein D3C71_2107500 [compost metagenome]